MAKGEAKKTNRYIDQEREQANREYGGISDELRRRLPGASDRSNRAFESAFGGYQNLIDRARSGGPSGRGYGDIESKYSKLYDTGGLSDENISRIRGNGVFDEFARTGGLSEADKQNLRARSTATLPSFFENIKNNLSRTNAVQGGYSPGYDAQMSQLARDQAYGANRVATEAEGDIVDRVTQGRQWGAGSLSSAEQGLSELLSRNKLAGLEGMFGARRAGSDDDYRNYAAGLQAELGGLEGLRGLRTDQPGEEFGLFDRLLESAGGRSGAAGSNLNLRSQYNPNVSFMDRLAQFGGLAAGAAPAFMGGGGRSRIPGGSGQPTRLPRQRNVYDQFYG